jgi:hypothetical protein
MAKKLGTTLPDDWIPMLQLQDWTFCDLKQSRVA